MLAALPGEFLVGHAPSRVWRFGLALVKSSPLLGRVSSK